MQSLQTLTYCTAELKILGYDYVMHAYRIQLCHVNQYTTSLNLHLLSIPPTFLAMMVHLLPALIYTQQN